MLRYEWIWKKEQGTGGANCNKMPLKDHENVLVFYNKLPKYNPQFSVGKPYKIKRDKPKLDSVYGKTGLNDSFISINDGKRYPKTVIEFNRDSNKIHPTQKPVALFEYLIKTYSNEGDLILDNCAGSFTTAIACDNLNRNWICIEKDEKYFELGTKRVKEN